MLKTLEAAARCGGEIIRSAEAARVTEKDGRRNLVTEYDVQVQDMLRARLLGAYPDAHFVGEEGDAQDDALHGLAFIVDPIDGTANFVRGYRASAVSIAAAQDGEVVCGVVYDPYTDTLFAAEKGRGAWANGTPIHVSDNGLAESIVCLGTASYYPDTFEHTFRLARALFDAAMDFRRSGSAALDLCYVAAGRADLMFEARLCPWDYAAAGLVVTEAGGRIAQLSGAPVSLTGKCSVLAGAPRAWKEFFDKGLDKI
ncbi:MAG: inositol monophosphatase [Butyricicoccus sp.]|nr:inositol monophosphatase [Butyricicoccus sp.]